MSPQRYEQAKAALDTAEAQLAAAEAEARRPPAAIRQHGLAALAEPCRMDLEAIVLKRLNSRYRSGPLNSKPCGGASGDQAGRPKSETPSSASTVAAVTRSIACEAPITNPLGISPIQAQA